MELKEIKRTIRETKREMKELGIKRRSFMNGGLSPQEYSYNARLFQLSLDLEKASR